MKLKYDIAVWRRGTDNALYGFPIGATDPWGAEILAGLSTEEGWTFVATIPKSAPVFALKPDEGDRVRCSVASMTLFTGSWVIED